MNQNNMKQTIGFLILLFLVLEMHGQGPANNPDYNPLIPKLLSIRHEANSNTIKYRKFSEDILSSKQLNESINIYVEYELDLEVAKDPKLAKKPPEKVMDLNLIYSYRYLIPYSSIENLNKLLPEIELKNNQIIQTINASNYSMKKGKAKKVRIKNKKIKIDTSEQKLTIRFVSEAISNSGFLELLIKTKTQYFNTLDPTFNTNGEFTRLLTISIPDIFKYQLPSDSAMFKLQSKKKGQFIFLDIDRGSRDWDNIIDEYWTDCYTYTYKVISKAKSLTNTSFKIEKLELAPGIDIGIPPSDLLLKRK